MRAEFNNPKLFKNIKKLISLLNVVPPIKEEIKDLWYLTNHNWIRLSVGAQDEATGYFYTTVNVYFQVESDPASPLGYKLTDNSYGYSVWGYLNTDITNFIVDDFTYFYKDKNGEDQFENFFRDVINSKEAQVVVDQMSNNIIKNLH